MNPVAARRGRSRPATRCSGQVRDLRTTRTGAERPRSAPALSAPAGAARLLPSMSDRRDLLSCEERHPEYAAAARLEPARDRQVWLVLAICLQAGSVADTTPCPRRRRAARTTSAPRPAPPVARISTTAGRPPRWPMSCAIPKVHPEAVLGISPSPIRWSPSASRTWTSSTARAGSSGTSTRSATPTFPTRPSGTSSQDLVQVLCPTPASWWALKYPDPKGDNFQPRRPGLVRRLPLVRLRSPPDPAEWNVGCEMCHGAGSAHAASDPGQHPNRRGWTMCGPTCTCIQCHLGQPTRRGFIGQVSRSMTMRSAATVVLWC